MAEVLSSGHGDVHFFSSPSPLEGLVSWESVLSGHCCEVHSSLTSVWTPEGAWCGMDPSYAGGLWALFRQCPP